MWPFKRNPRFVAYLDSPEVARAAANSLYKLRGFARYLLRFSEEQAQRVIDAYTHQPGPTRHDPIEDDPTYTAVFAEVNKEIQALYPEKRRGLCHRVWAKQKELLLARGVDWILPSQLNSFHRFD